MVYMHRSNALIAFAPQVVQPVELSLVKIVAAPSSNIKALSVSELQIKLNGEVTKMIRAGHLRPGYFSSGIVDLHASRTCGDDLLDYWHNPADTIITLLQALPYLTPLVQNQAITYIQSEFSKYSPYQFNHIGWKDGASREAFMVPLEPSQDMAATGPWPINWEYIGWQRNPMSFYAIWKYAEKFGGATSLYNATKDLFEKVPSDAYLIEFPAVHNAYIAGYIGYLELQKLAGVPETASMRQDLNRLLSLRASTFSKDVPDKWSAIEAQNGYSLAYCHSFAVSRNFMNMTPELAAHLQANASDKVRQAIQEYNRVAPYWFVTRHDSTFGEGAIDHYYNSPTNFQARALILKEPYQQLIKYLDVPAVATGDLFYIQNLITLIKAAN
jgi:hypothetical protein